jgi:uncharacterized protein
MPTVARFNVTPVKSTALQHPDEVVVSELGIEGAHRFLFTDQDGGRLSSEAKKPLLSIQTAFDPVAGVLRATLDAGHSIEADVSAEAETCEIRLYDRTVTGRVVGAAIAEAVSAKAGRALRLLRVDEPEYAGGEHRLTLVSLASVRDLGRRAGLEDDGPDARRFRMTIELEGCEPYEEDSWNGRRVRLGDAVVRVGEGVPRCELTTMHPVTGEKDFPALKVLATYRRQDGKLRLGVYADVVQPGRIRVGDDVDLL